MKKLFFAAAATLLIGGLASCKDSVKLDDAEAVYITITPQTPYLTVAGDTITLSATVKNLDGEAIEDAVITWSIDDESVARFVEGTPRIYAVKGGEGKSTKIRATLQNGKYATTNVSVNKLSSATLTAMLTNTQAASDTIYVATGANTDLLVVTRPEKLLEAYTPEILEVDESLFTIGKRALDPEADKAVIEATPKGGIWYTIRPVPGKTGTHTFKYKVGSNVLPIVVKVGTRVNDDSNATYGVALNAGMSEAELSKTVNLGHKETVTVYVKATPATEEAFNEIKNDLVWKLAGAGGTITATSAEYTADAFLFKADVTAGAIPGEFSVSATIQGKTARQSYRVEDFASKPFTGLTFGRITEMELQTGEQKPLTLVVNPRASQAAILSDINSMVKFSKPDIAEFINDNGVYQLRGLAAGQTNFIVTVRGQEFALPITVVAAPTAVTIDNTTPVGVMAGDVVDWSAVVTMAGTDQPTYSFLTWSTSDATVAGINGSATGQKVQLIGKEVTEPKTVTVKADYRGKSMTRELTVYPVQPNAEFANDKIDVAQSGLLYNSTKLEFVLSALSGHVLPSPINVKPKSGSIAFTPGSTYNAADYNIDVNWKTLSKHATSGTIKVTEGTEAGKINITFDLTLKLHSGKEVRVTGTLTNLQAVS